MNKIKKSAGEQAFDICNVLLQLIVAVIMVYPMLYVVFSSLSDPIAFVGHKGMLWHSIGFTLDSYEAALKHPMLLQGYANTLFILTFGVSINIILTTFGAYFLSRRNVRYQKDYIYIHNNNHVHKRRYDSVLLCRKGSRTGKQPVVAYSADCRKYV